MKIHERLQAWRKKDGRLQVACAKRVKVSQPTWSRIERGVHVPRAELRARIEKLTGGAIKGKDWK